MNTTNGQKRVKVLKKKIHHLPRKHLPWKQLSQQKIRAKETAEHYSLKAMGK